jgi:hypothetical protein
MATQASQVAGVRGTRFLAREPLNVDPEDTVTIFGMLVAIT